MTLTNLSGFCVYPNISDIESFKWDFASELEWRDAHYILKNGRVMPMRDENFSKIICDFDGRDFDLNGYLSGFIYPNGKFLGKWYYVNEARTLPQPLNGTYNLTENGIQLKGTWLTDENKKYGFFIRLETERAKMEMQKPKKKREPNAQKIVKEKTDTLPEILTKGLLEKITSRSLRVKKGLSPEIFNHYNHVVGLKLKPQKIEDIILAMSIAYSWMPTMLDVYLPKNPKSLIDAVQGLGSIRSLKAFEANQDQIEKWLKLLANTVNHSIVGASKTLHILYPKTIPIIDRRVLRGWEKTFNSHFKKQPSLKLPKGIPQDRSRMIQTYMKYWKILLYWSNNINNKDIRKLEEPFYLLGK